MKTNRRSFISIVAGAITGLVVTPIKAAIKFDESADKVVKLSGPEIKYFIANSCDTREIWKSIYIDDVQQHDVCEMHAAKEPGVTVQGFAIVYVRDWSKGCMKYKFDGNSTNLLRKQINGMIRWECVKEHGCSNS